MNFSNFWYVVAQSEQLTEKTALARTILDEWLVIFRDENNKPVALQDRCIHRNSRLSAGKVKAGKVQCPYHGWQYDRAGKVVAVPAEGENPCAKVSRGAIAYATKEQDGYIYVCLSQPSSDPFIMPHYQSPDWSTVRVINRFQNTVTNCAENFHRHSSHCLCSSRHLSPDKAAAATDERREKSWHRHRYLSPRDRQSWLVRLVLKSAGQRDCSCRPFSNAEHHQRRVRHGPNFGTTAPLLHHQSIRS